MDSCKYVHYQVEPADLKRLFHKLQRLDRNPQTATSAATTGAIAGQSQTASSNDQAIKIENQSSAPVQAQDKKKGWIEFSPLPPIDFEKLRKEKIEKLIQSKKA